MVLISFLSAVIPAIALLVYYYKQDKAKPEPKGLVIKIFILGILSIIPVILVELFISSAEPILEPIPFMLPFFSAFIVAGLVEESFKFLIVKKFAFNKDPFDEHMDGIVYTVAASMGFACLENVIYVLNTNISTALIRAVTAVPLHAFASGIMGFYIGKAKFASSELEQDRLFRKGLISAIFIHGSYNFFLMAAPDMAEYFGDAGALSSFLIVPIIIYAFIKLRQLVKAAISSDRSEGRI